MLATAGGGGVGLPGAATGARLASAVAGIGSSVQRSLWKSSMSAAVTPLCDQSKNEGGWPRKKVRSEEGVGDTRAEK